MVRIPSSLVFMKLESDRVVVFSGPSENDALRDQKLQHISERFIRIKPIVLGSSSGFMCMVQWERTIIQFYLSSSPKRISNGEKVKFYIGNC